MKKVIPKSIYQHFKGNYYYVNLIVLDSETKENVIIYTGLYDDHKTYCRKESMFLEEITARADNVTGQKHRFELIDMEREFK